jgi:hypothetical protein
MAVADYRKFDCPVKNRLPKPAFFGYGANSGLVRHGRKG